MIKEFTYKVYTIDSHPNKNLVFNWVRENWEIYDSYIQEFAQSLRALDEKLKGALNWSVGPVACDSFIKVQKDFDIEVFEALYNERENCPLTGVCYDVEILEGLKSRDFSKALEGLETDCNHSLTEEYLSEHLLANEYYFKESGEIE